MDAIGKNLPISSNIDWSGKLFYSYDTRIVSCLKGNCSNIDKTKITYKTAAEIRKIIPQQEMYQRYANLKPGDILTHKEVCDGVCSPSGHSRLVTETPVVVYGANNKIDGDKSYVYVTEITKKSVEKPIGTSYINSWLDLSKPNIKTFIKNFGFNISTYENYPTEWRLSKKYSFNVLYYGEKDD